MGRTPPKQAGNGYNCVLTILEYSKGFRKSLMAVDTLLRNGSGLRESVSPPDLIEDRPRDLPITLLGRDERERAIERAFAGLYRWYVARSQKMRNWNPDADFKWGAMRHDLSPDTVQLIEGFFAVEQYTPDYTSEILRIVRRSNGRSNFQLRWGAEGGTAREHVGERPAVLAGADARAD